MTLLNITQSAARRLQITPPSTVIGNTDNNIILLLSTIEDVIQNIRDEYPWPELQKECLFTTIANVDSYPLPGDFNFTQCETLWNRTQRWPLLGPLDAVLWQTYKSGILTTLPRQRFRIKGFTNNQFFIDPVPTTNEIEVYEYLTRTAIRPKTWVANTAYTQNTYAFYNGLILVCSTAGTSSTTAVPEFGRDGSVFWNAVPAFVASDSYFIGQYICANSKVYQCTVTGKSSATAPSHTSGSVVNGTCTFLYISTPTTWAAGTAYTVSTSTVVNSLTDCYICAASGTSGLFEPTFRSNLPTSGIPQATTTDLITDGTAVWTVIKSAYETFNADTDEVILDNQMVVDEAVWNFLQIRGFDYQELKAQADNRKDIMKTKLQGTGVLSVNQQTGLPPMIGLWSYPQGNFGV